MKILSGVIRSTTRIRSLVALLTLTAVGSSWLVLRADVPRVASGTWAAAGEVAVPSGAVSVTLADGRVVVAGGKSDGVPSSAISTYAPASGAWAPAGELLTPRSGHAMALLNDGRVLIAGGTASDGPTFDIEIFDPANGTSVHAGDMTLPRVDHAAATLKDGRVLIVGGSDGVAPMSLAEIFDPATGQSQGVGNAMSTARVKATATTMIDGHVLVVGGNDGANDLASAEIFEPATGSFFGTGAMQVARSGHVAVLLPNNNQVLIAGGMSAGAAVASAELYADWRDGFSATTPMSAARLGAIAGGLQRYDVAFVAGGNANTGDYYGYATVKSDKDDYAPYETVTISGSGWQPGEKVHLRVSEDADTHTDWELEAIADEFGNIVNREFYPRNDEVYHHIGMRFYLTAVGIGSQALTTFTDAMQTETLLTSSLNPSLATQSVTFTATVRMNDKKGNTDNWKPAVGGSVEFYDRTTAQDACDKQNGNYGSLLGTSPVNAGQASLAHTFSSGGSYPIMACYKGTGGNDGTQNSASPQITQTVNSAVADTTTTASNASATFSASNQNVTLSATVSSTNTVNAGTVTFTVTNGAVTIGSPVLASVNSGSASETFVLPANTPAGTYSIQAAYSGATNFNSSGDNTKTLTVGQGNQATVTVSAPPSATYQQAGLSAVASGGSGTGAYSYSHGASTACTVSSTTGALTITSGTGTCDITASRAGDANYNASAASAPESVTINKAPASISANAKTKTYGDANPTLDATEAGKVGTDTLNYSLATAAVQTSGVGSYPITVTLGSNPNYTITTEDAALTVSPALATVKANAKTKTYGDANPTLDATEAGKVGSDTLNYTLATTAVQTSGVGSYPITVTLGSNPNYTVTTEDAALTVSPALATVKANAKSKTYGDANPTLDATEAGKVGSDTLNYSLATTAVQTSGVGSYPITVTLGSNPNYTVTTEDAALTVSPALATVKANAKSKTYGDANPTLDATEAGKVGSDTLNYSLATTAVQTSGVGSYPITVTLGSNPNYTVTTEDAALTVSPALATVKANAKTKTYGAANPTLDATEAGKVGTDTLNYSLATAAVQTSGVGSYPITVTLGSNPNYTITTEDAALTVSPALATVKANAKTKTYGDANPTLDATEAGKVGTDTLNYSLATAAVQTSGVGSYPITVTLGSNPNYTITTEDAALTVSPALATVKANAKTKTYGDANPTLDATESGKVGSDTLNYSLATTAVQTSGVGSYPITVTLGSNPNYTITVVNGNLTIGKRTLTITPDGGKTKILGEVFTGFMGTVAGLQGSDAGTAAYASPGAAAGAPVGSYDITVTFTFTNGSLSNYDLKLETAVKGLVVLYRWDGFLQPINDTAHELGSMSKFKAGQTIPAKFVLKNAAGAAVQQTGIPTFTRTNVLGACDSSAALENPEPVPASVVPQYTWDGAQYHYNWSTKGLPPGLYRIFANLGDGMARSVDICLTK